MRETTMYVLGGKHKLDAKLLQNVGVKCCNIITSVTLKKYAPSCLKM